MIETSSEQREMPFFRYKPAPPLSEFVRLLWYVNDYTLPHKKERLLPDGSVELVINLHQDVVRLYDREDPTKCTTLPGTVVCGPHSQHFIIDTAEQREVLGVHFLPGGAFPFLNLPISEIFNQHVPLDCLWPDAARRIRERALEAPTPIEKMKILECELTAEMSDRLEMHPAVRYALREFQHVRSVAPVVSAVGLSPRRFIEVFAQQTGFTPKLYCRVRRFQEAFTRSRAGQRVEWADVALSCGYFDQAHFVHDFRAFSGLNPSEYLTLRNEHQNHVPLA